jgi:hypothetical protein
MNCDVAIAVGARKVMQAIGFALLSGKVNDSMRGNF